MKEKKRRKKCDFVSTDFDLNYKLAKAICVHWPSFLPQQKIAEEIDVSQSLISKQLKKWVEVGRAPFINMEFQEPRNKKEEKNLKEEYDLEDVIVLEDNAIDVRSKNYFDIVGMSSSKLLMSKVQNIISRKKLDKSSEYKIKVAGSCGRNVFATLNYLADECKEANIKLTYSSCTALRSDQIIELTPIHIVSQLLNKTPVIEIRNTYQLPEMYPDTDTEEVTNVRIDTLKRMRFDQKILENDIVIFSIGNISNVSTDNGSVIPGFMQHTKNLGSSGLLDKLGIIGEIAFAPFNEKGEFLFHHLVKNVFKLENGEFIHDKEERKKMLESYSKRRINIDDKDIESSLKLLNSIFTMNFCSLKENRKKQNKKPYIILVVCGEQRKSRPLKTLLKKWKSLSIINALVTCKSIAEKL